MNKVILSKISWMGLIVISLGLSIAPSHAGRSKDGHPEEGAALKAKKSSSKKLNPLDAVLIAQGFAPLKPSSSSPKPAKNEKPKAEGEKKASRRTTTEKKEHKTRPKAPAPGEPGASGVQTLPQAPLPVQPPRPSSGKASRDIPPVEPLRSSSRPAVSRGSGNAGNSSKPLDQILAEAGYAPLGAPAPRAKPQPAAGPSRAAGTGASRPPVSRPSAAGPSRAPREVDDRWTIGMVEQVLRNRGLTLPNGVNTSADEAYWTAVDVLADLNSNQRLLQVLPGNLSFREEIQHALTHEDPFLLETSLTNLCKQQNLNPMYLDALRRVREDRLYEAFAVLEGLGYSFEPDSKYAMHKKFKEFEGEITAYVNDRDPQWGAARLGELFEREWIEPLTPFADRDYPDYRRAGLGYRLMCALDRRLLNLDDLRGEMVHAVPYYELIQAVLRAVGLTTYTPPRGEKLKPGEERHYTLVGNKFMGESEVSTKGVSENGFEDRRVQDVILREDGETYRVKPAERFLAAFPREPLAQGDTTPVARLSVARVNQEKVNQLTLDERVRPWLSNTKPPKMVSWHKKGNQWIPVKWSARKGKLVEDMDDTEFLVREDLQQLMPSARTWDEAYERLVPWANAWETAPRVEWPEPTGF